MARHHLTKFWHRDLATVHCQWAAGMKNTSAWGIHRTRDLTFDNPVLTVPLNHWVWDRYRIQ